MSILYTTLLCVTKLKNSEIPIDKYVEFNFLELG